MIQNIFKNFSSKYELRNRCWELYNINTVNYGMEKFFSEVPNTAKIKESSSLDKFKLKIKSSHGNRQDAHVDYAKFIFTI